LKWIEYWLIYFSHLMTIIFCISVKLVAALCALEILDILQIWKIVFTMCPINWSIFQVIIPRILFSRWSRKWLFIDMLTCHSFTFSYFHYMTDVYSKLSNSCSLTLDSDSQIVSTSLTTLEVLQLDNQPLCKFSLLNHYTYRLITYKLDFLNYC